MVAEIDNLKAATKAVLHDIAKHATALATGLQNAAPPKDSGPGKSVLYLTEIATVLEDICRTIDGLPPSHKND